MVKTKSNTRVTPAKRTKAPVRAAVNKVPVKMKAEPIVPSEKSKKGAVAKSKPESVPALAGERLSMSKKALITTLLRRADGAAVSELIGQTGWLPHSLRAALTGLRKEGFDITRSRSADGQTTYRISSEVSA